MKSNSGTYWLLNTKKGSIDGTSITPIAVAKDRKKLESFATEHFKSKSPNFARDPFWTEGKFPPGYEIHDISAAKASALPEHIERVGIRESILLEGTVKWLRHDGTGYIEHDGESYFFDTSCINGDESEYAKGAKVSFELKSILGRKVAKNVKVI